MTGPPAVDGTMLHFYEYFFYEIKKKGGEAAAHMSKGREQTKMSRPCCIH